MNTEMALRLALTRVQWATTIMFHCLFPQLTMGLALMIAAFAAPGYWWGHEAPSTARFWTQIFAVTSAFGVATGVPMEFQFGANWVGFAKFAGGVVRSIV